ncbi:conserved hypothetical protein [uncultured Desulfovibrio sp.]|uniref:Uncharacterized protein n=2 Tax=Desulfovibrio TaxID=872 RepID=A0A212IWF5_9BACT|nr:hypothetical protein [uncultured Desulfovibrio sp.]SBV91553.1 conserved hypothetical protein [uncultured Desulfovibrio sp.]
MPVDTLLQLLQLALAVIGTLITLLIALIVYVFLSLKSEVRQVQSAVSEQGLKQARLVHKTECREVEDAINDHLERHDSQLLDHSQRIVRMETRLDARGGRHELS